MGVVEHKRSLRGTWGLAECFSYFSSALQCPERHKRLFYIAFIIYFEVMKCASVCKISLSCCNCSTNQSAHYILDVLWYKIQLTFWATTILSTACMKSCLVSLFKNNVKLIDKNNSFGGKEWIFPPKNCKVTETTCTVCYINVTVRFLVSDLAVHALISNHKVYISHIDITYSTCSFCHLAIFGWEYSLLSTKGIILIN
jgi:hypothetical protein